MSASSFAIIPGPDSALSTTISGTTPVAVIAATPGLALNLKYYYIQAKAANSANVVVTLTGTKGGNPLQIHIGDYIASQAYGHSIDGTDGYIQFDVNTALNIALSVSGQVINFNAEYQLV